MDGTFRTDYLTSPFNGFSPSQIDGGETAIPTSDMEDIISFDFSEVTLATFENGFAKRFVGDPQHLYKTIPQNTWGTIATFNALGFYMTQAMFMRQIGYFPTFHQEVSDKIGGYPKGAILRCVMRHGVPYNDLSYDGWLMDVVSMQDNNTKNFVYDENTNPNPYQIGEPDADGVIWWKFVTTHKPHAQSSILPDLLNGTMWKPKRGNETCVTGDSLAFTATMESSASKSTSEQEVVYYVENEQPTDVISMLVNYNTNVMTPALSSAKYLMRRPPTDITLIMFYPLNVPAPAENYTEANG